VKIDAITGEPRESVPMDIFEIFKEIFVGVAVGVVTGLIGWLFLKFTASIQSI